MGVIAILPLVVPVHAVILICIARSFDHRDPRPPILQPYWVGLLRPDDSFVRRSELVCIQLSDVELDCNRIKVSGKGGKEGHLIGLIR